MKGSEIKLIHGQILILSPDSENNCIWKRVRVNKNLTITPLEIVPRWSNTNTNNDLGKTFSATCSVFPKVKWYLDEIHTIDNILKKYNETPI